MSHKKDRMKTSKLSSTVLDYYYKYGQNRDLEKYLRMKRQNSSKSSSDSSLKNFESAYNVSDTRRITKSMEKLDFSDNKTKSKDDLEHKASKSAEIVDETGDGIKQTNKSNEKDQIKIEKKTQQQFKGKSKSKSYNFNLESSIEINLPAATSMPTLPASTQIIETIPKPIRKLQLESAETQTEAFFTKSVPTISVEKSPAVASTSSALKSNEIKKQDNTIQETSPASSVASAKVRLEWDSMADIGYNRIIDFKSQSNTNLTTFEKSALTKFFAKRGLNFDDNLVILAPVDGKSPLHKREFTQSAIEMREAQRIKKDYPNLSPTTNERLWEKALEKYREKYGKTKSDATSGIDSTQFMSFSSAPHHSTPLPIDVSVNDENFNQSQLKPIESVKEMPKIQQFEKWSQTTSIGVEAIGIQVEQPQIQHISKSIQIEIEQVNESTQMDDGDLTTATSFEFFAPNEYNKQQIPEPKVPIPIETSDIEIPKRDEMKNESDYIQDENPDDKENIPPIDDKENIPPPPLHAMSRTSKPSSYKTPEQTINKPTEISILPNDLQKSVDLINTLIDSRKIDSADKKKLIRKIVRYLLKSRDTKDITQMIMSYSEKSNSKISGVSTLTDLEDSEQSAVEKTAKSGVNSISGVSALSSSSTSSSAVVQQKSISGQGPVIVEQVEKKIEPVESEKLLEKTEENKPVEVNQEKGVKDWLLPMTQSEIEKENARKSQINQSVEIIQCEKPKPIRQISNQIEPTNNAEKSPIKNNEIIEFLEHEKQTHFNWIDQEIKHLKNLKFLLNNLNTSDSSSSKGNVSVEEINSVYAKHDRDYLAIYENFRRHKKYVSGRGSQADISSSLIDSSKSSEDCSRFINQSKMGKKSHWIHKTTLESPSTTISSGSIHKPRSKQSVVEPIKPKVSNELPEWNSHLNMQQLVKNRTKLKTPDSDESIEAYAKACRAKFDRKLAIEKSEHEKKIMTKNCARVQPIYTKPYSSDSYSDIQNIRRNNENRIKSKESAAYTSVTESDGFLSPNSISIGVAANSTSNTTTHQYDTKISVGLQTTNTLERMPMIQLKKPVDVPTDPVIEEQPTRRVNKLTINKQLQVRPEALAYILMFEEQQNEDINTNTKECANQLYANANKVKSVNISSSSTDSDAQKHQISGNIPLKRKNNNLSGILDDNLTLQECLQIRRPDFYANAEERRKCLNYLHNLRQKRNEQRKKLFAMNICTNARTLNKNMKRLLPPPPLAQMRIFKSREIISQTRRKYKKLPEILKRQQMEREQKIRRNQRILVNVFSKNLQKHVLSGKTDLSNSMMIN